MADLVKKENGLVISRKEEDVSSIADFLRIYSQAASFDQSIGQVPIVQTISPEKNIQTRDKISKTLLDEHVINQGQQFLKMEKAASVSLPVTTKVNISLDMDSFLEEGPNNRPIVNGYEFSYYDKCVFDAICSLLFARNNLITTPMIARAMAGKDWKYHPSPDNLEEIEASMKKLSQINVDIDLSEEFRAFKGLNKNGKQGNNARMIISDKFLSFRKITCVMNSKPVIAFQLRNLPPLFEYALIRGQISSNDIKILSTPLNKTTRNLAIQNYLISRINSMQSSRKLSRTIIFEKIYMVNEDYEEKKTNKAALKSYLRSVNKDIQIMLDYWAEIGFIHGYEIQSIKKKKYGKIIIDLGDERPRLEVGTP